MGAKGDVMLRNGFLNREGPQYYLPELPQSNRFFEIAQGRRGRREGVSFGGRERLFADL